MTNLTDRKTVRYEEGVFAYTIFKPEVSGSSLPGCVISTAVKKGASSVNLCEIIINSICTAEEANWRDMDFYDLQTHVGYTNCRAFYEFEKLIFTNEPRSTRLPVKDPCPYVNGWQALECPLPVFKSYEDLIGPFYSLREVISRERPCYKDFSDRQLAEEMEWAVDWEKQEEEIYSKIKERLGKQLHTPAQALEMGFHLVPGGISTDRPKTDNLGDCIVVDMVGSHLRGQFHGLKHTPPLMVPPPFAYWKKAA